MGNSLELVFLFLIASCLPLTKYPVKYGGGFHVKECLFIVFGVGYLCISVLSGMRYVDSVIGNMFLLFVAYTTLSVIWTTNVEQSWEDIAKWWGLYALFIIASSLPVNTVMILSILPVPLFLAWGFLQEHGIDPTDKELQEEFQQRTKNQYKGSAYSFWGSIGNTNHSASLLAPYVFITLYLAVNISPFFYCLLPPLFYGLYLTQCHSAWLGVMVGLCFVYPPYSLFGLLAIVIVVGILFYVRKFHPEFYKIHFQHKEYNLVSRTHYWRVAFQLWKKAPVFGMGIRSFRREHYETQAIMNQKDPTLLGYKEGPEPSEKDRDAKYSFWPTRAHNDYIEILSDLGIIGFLLFGLFLGAVIVSAVLQGNYLLLSGVICLAVGGVLFYTLSTFSYVPYIILMATATNSVSEQISLPILLGVVIALVGLKVIHSYAIGPQLALLAITNVNTIGKNTMQEIMAISVKKAEILEKIKNTDKNDHLRLLPLHNELELIQKKTEEIARKGFESQNIQVDRAMRLAPSNGYIINAAIGVKSKFDPWLALHYAERSIHHFDGLMRLWSTWTNYGALLHATGNWEGAKRAFRYALYLNPSGYEARTLLRGMEERERELAEQQKQGG